MESCPSCDSALERMVDESVEEEMTTPVVTAPSTGGRPLSIIGIAFAVLAAVAVVGLVLVLNYDTWIAGEDESNIGDTQMTYVYLAAAAVVVCVALVAWDWIRSRRAAPA